MEPVCVLHHVDQPLLDLLLLANCAGEGEFHLVLCQSRGYPGGELVPRHIDVVDSFESDSVEHSFNLDTQVLRWWLGSLLHLTDRQSDLVLIHTTLDLFDLFFLSLGHSSLFCSFLFCFEDCLSLHLSFE